MATDALIGTYLGKYKIEELIGRGGMAEVYRATQVALGRNVAIKVMHRFLSDDDDFLSRFEREAKVLAKIRHQNIVHVHDYQAEDDYYYIVMDYLSGGTLKNQLDKLTIEGGVIDLKRTATVILEVGEALAYAHGMGMVHRDIKPANIMFDEKGIAVLTDFGIAKMIGVSSHTTTGSMIGTPAYMSPEQGLGESGDERSDIYSLGVLAFHLMTGNLPFEGDTPLSVVLKHVNENPPRPSSVNPDIPVVIEEIILKAMDKNPDNRWPAVSEMNRELRIALKAAGMGAEIDFSRPSILEESHTPLPVGLTVPNSEHDSLAGRIARNPVNNAYTEQSATMIAPAEEENGFAAAGYEPLPESQPETVAKVEPPSESIIKTSVTSADDLESMNLLPDLPNPTANGNGHVPRPQREPARAPELPPIPATAEASEQELLPNLAVEVDAYESVGAVVSNEKEDGEFATEMTDFLTDFSKSATEAAKIKPELNPLTKKANKRRKREKMGQTMRGIITTCVVLAGIIIGILYVTRINPTLDIPGIIDKQLNNPQIEDLDLENIMADGVLTVSPFSRSSLSAEDQGIVLSVSNRSSIPPSWVASLEFTDNEDTWSEVDGKLAMFDNGGEVVWQVDESLSRDGVYRWVIRPNEGSSDVIGVSDIFLLPTGEGEITEVTVEAN